MGREALERSVLMEKGRALTQPAQGGLPGEVVLSYMAAHTQWLISARALRAPQLCYLDAALKEHRMRHLPCALGLGSYRHPCSEGPSSKY